MSIVLLNIPCENIVEKRYEAPDYPDPSLGSLHSYLKNNNIESQVIDSKLARFNLRQVISKLKYYKPETIGFTAFTHEIDHVAKAASIIKENLPGTRMLIGGAHANALPEKVLSENKIFDIALYGEGEITLAELKNKNFQNLDSISGIAYRENGNIILNKKRDYLDFATIPLVDWTDFPKAKHYPVFTSRGCSYNCIFCSRPFGSKVRFRDSQDILKELEVNVRLFDPKMVYFWDENLCHDRDRIEKLLQSKKKNKIIKNTKWFCQSHINNLDYDLLKLMKEAGCVRVGIGLESGNDEMLKKIGKGTTKKRCRQVMEWLKKINIPVEGYFLLGLPDETKKTCMDTINFAAELNPKFPVFGIVVPYPGTAIYNIAVAGKSGYRMISSHWADYNKIIGKAMELEGLSRKDLETFQARGYLAVLLRNFRIGDAIRFLFEYFYDIKGYFINHFKAVKTKVV